MNAQSRIELFGAKPKSCNSGAPRVPATWLYNSTCKNDRGRLLTANSYKLTMSLFTATSSIGAQGSARVQGRSLPHRSDVSAVPGWYTLRLMLMAVQASPHVVGISRVLLSIAPPPYNIQVLPPRLLPTPLHHALFPAHAAPGTITSVEPELLRICFG